MAADVNTGAQSINSERTSLVWNVQLSTAMHCQRSTGFISYEMQISRALLVLQSAPITVILAMFYKQESSYFRSNETTTNARKA